MSIFSRFLPKKKPPEIKNNIPKEKANIKKTFAVYCHKEHGTAVLTASQSQSATAVRIRAFRKVRTSSFVRS